MRRTAADFAAEARDEPYELELDDGTVITPRSRHDFSYDENAAESANAALYARWFEENPGRPFPDGGAELDGERVVSPDEWTFRTRFGENYDAWWAEWRGKPLRQITNLLTDIDKFYDPTPAPEREKAAAAAGDADAAGKSGAAPTS